jgi:hypothetical protein
LGLPTFLLLHLEVLMHSAYSLYQKQKSSPKVHASNPRVVTTKIAGVTFEHRQSVIATLEVGNRLELRRDPTNRYDRNAIMVITSTGKQAGFIPAVLAARLAPVMDTNCKAIAADVLSITGDPSKGYSLGVMIQFTLPCDLPNPNEVEALDI